MSRLSYTRTDYLYSSKTCIDLGLRFDRNPFSIDYGDIHPPLSARVNVCYRSLTSDHKNEKVVVSASNVWKNYEQNQTGNGEFGLVCSDILLNRLVEAALHCIQQMLPNAKQYNKPLLKGQEAEQMPQGNSLEDMLNRAVQILFTYPEHYADWERQAFRQLKQKYQSNERL